MKVDRKNGFYVCNGAIKWVESSCDYLHRNYGTNELLFMEQEKLNTYLIAVAYLNDQTLVYSVFVYLT